MLADGYGECYGFNLKDKFICTVYFEPVPLAKENTCETCVKRCFTSTSKTPTTSTVTSTTTSTTTVTTAPAVVTAPAAAAADPNKWQTYATFDLRDFFQPFFKDPTFLFMASFSSPGQSSINIVNMLKMLGKECSFFTLLRRFLRDLLRGLATPPVLGIDLIVTMGLQVPAQGIWSKCSV